MSKEDKRVLAGVRPRHRVALKFGGETRTKQSMAEQCDINRIMGRYLKSGNVDHVAKHGGDYGYASSQTFHEAMNVVRKAEQMFMDLPSEVRKKFHHDPGEFLDFVGAVNDDGEPVNLEEMRKLKLALPAVEEPDVPVTRVKIVDDERRFDDTHGVDESLVVAPEARSPARSSSRGSGGGTPPARR